MGVKDEFMEPSKALTLTSGIFQSAPLPLPVRGGIAVCTIGLRFYRAQERVKMYEKVDLTKDWTKLLAGEFANLVIDQSETAQKTIQMAALCLNIDRLIQSHNELSKAYENLGKAIRGDMPFYEKRRWNDVTIASTIRYQWVRVEQRMHKIVECLLIVLKKGLALSDCYLISRDLFNGDPLARYDAVRRMCLNPNESLKTFLANKGRIERVLQENKQFIEGTFKMVGFDGADTFKKHLMTFCEVQEKVIAVSEKTFNNSQNLLTTFFQPMFNPIEAMNKQELYQKRYENLGLKSSSKESVVALPFPVWLGEKISIPVKEIPKENKIEEKEEVFIEPDDEDNNSGSGILGGLFNSIEKVSSMFQSFW